MPYLHAPDFTPGHPQHILTADFCRRSARYRMRRILPLPAYAGVTALLPVIAVHLSYAIAVNAGEAAVCVPYWDGCTSISRAARFGLANIMFKALMLPHAAVLAGFWGLCWLWLRQLRPDAPLRCNATLLLGGISALFLVLYASFLGVDGATYQWLRRYGITVFFAFSVLAQMLVVALLQPIDTLGLGLRRIMLLFAAALLALGLCSIPLQALGDAADAAVNALEWCYALLMTAFYALIGIGWKHTGFNLQARVRRRTTRNKQLSRTDARPTRPRRDSAA
jgi:hypothetical protein